MQSAIEVLHAPPPSSSLISLAQHQAQTPASFYDGPAVLYHHATGCQLVALKRDLKLLSLLKAVAAGDGSANAEEKQGNKEEILDGVDVWVTSRRLYIYLTSLSSGVAIPYPVISLHAIQKITKPGASESDEQVQGLYMRLILTTGDGNGEETQSGNNRNEDEDGDEDMYDEIGESVTMTIIPPSSSPSAAAAETATAGTTTSTSGITDVEKHESPTESLYAALSACSDLHPDPNPEGNDIRNDNDAAIPNFPIYNMPPPASFADSHLYQAGLVQQGAVTGLPPPMPGSDGWITAENAHEFFDEDGNWKNRDGNRDDPPAAAGMKRTGDDGEEGFDEEETKWRRTGK
ncbi:hypothetical protein KEM54_003233 [Ascosphaera aggregata]|nr:hypothetical protein KEM54_003233 [Ascosphaera aggregata]